MEPRELPVTTVKTVLTEIKDSLANLESGELEERKE